MSPRVLVVFYSRTGTTLGVALRLTRLWGADLEIIQDTVCRHGLLGFLRSAREARRGREPRLRELQFDPSKYDIVIVATPVWAGHMASPIRTYLSKHSSALPETAFVVTSRGAGARRTLVEMKSLARKEPLSTLTVFTGEPRNQTAAHVAQFYESALQTWKVRSDRARSGPSEHGDVVASTT
jgi:flavodoxin